MNRRPHIRGRVPWELVIPLAVMLAVIAFSHPGQFYNCAHLPYTEAWNACVQP